jgi:hypothetical protein
MKPLLATFRRKIMFSDEAGASVMVLRSCSGGAFSPSLQEGGGAARLHTRATTIALPMLIRLSAITPSPTHLFNPSAPR